MMVSHPFTIVTPGKESIKAKVGQEHLKQQGFPQGKGGSVISPLTNMAKLHVNPCWNSFITNTRRYL